MENGRSRWHKPLRHAQIVGYLDRGATQRPSDTSTWESPPAGQPAPFSLSQTSYPGEASGYYHDHPASQPSQVSPSAPYQYNTFATAHGPTTTVTPRYTAITQQPAPQGTNYSQEPSNLYDTSSQGSYAAAQYTQYASAPPYGQGQNVPDLNAQSQQFQPQQQMQSPQQSTSHNSVDIARSYNFSPPAPPQRSHTVPGSLNTMSCGHDQWFYDRQLQRCNSCYNSQYARPWASS